MMFLALTVWLLVSWSDARTRDRSEEFDWLWARVPASIVIAPQALRILGDEAAEAQIGELLDRLVEMADMCCGPQPKDRPGLRPPAGCRRTVRR